MLTEVNARNFGAMDRAIAAEDFEAARVAYLATIQACNSCHMFSGHGFIVIKEPSAPPAANRDYRPK